MTSHDDRDLRARFRGLASAEVGMTPAFALPAPGHAAPRGPARMARAAAAVIAVGAAATVWSIARDGEAPYPIDLSAVSWTAPTDFLLQTPGADLFWALPTIEIGAANAPSGAPPNTIDTMERTRT